MLERRRGRAGCRSSSLSTSLSSVSRLARPGSASSSASSCCRGPGDVGSTSATSRSRRSAAPWCSLATVAAQNPVGRGGAGAGYQPVDSTGWLKVLVPAAGQQRLAQPVVRWLGRGHLGRQPAGEGLLVGAGRQSEAQRVADLGSTSPRRLARSSTRSSGTVAPRGLCDRWPRCPRWCVIRSAPLGSQPSTASS